MYPKEDKHQAILDASLKLISKNGFHGTSMAKVAREANVSVGNIYNYFDSKDELIDKVYKTVKQKSARAVLADIDRDQPADDQIRQLLQKVIHYSLRHPEEAAFIEMYVCSPYYHSSIEDEIINYFRPIRECFVQARKEMLIKDFPQSIIEILTLDLATALVQKQATGQLVLTDELIEKFIDASWDAIRQ
jgi:AcrR family transcriptional regulator